MGPVEQSNFALYEKRDRLGHRGALQHSTRSVTLGEHTTYNSRAVYWCRRDDPRDSRGG